MTCARRATGWAWCRWRALGAVLALPTLDAAVLDLLLDTVAGLAGAGDFIAPGLDAALVVRRGQRRSTRGALVVLSDGDDGGGLDAEIQKPAGERRGRLRPRHRLAAGVGRSCLGRWTPTSATATARGDQP